jgi:ketosteroid isomerase-like protein
MKRIPFTTLVLLVTLSFPSAVSHGKPMANKAGLEKTVNTFFDLVKANDVDKIKTYYTTDYSFTGPEGNIMGADERLKVLKESGGTFLSASGITVRIYGNAGVVTGIATTKNSSGATEQSRFIQMWTWQGGRWRLAASQVTTIA